MDMAHTVCPGSLDPFYQVTKNIGSRLSGLAVAHSLCIPCCISLSELEITKASIHN